MILFLEVIICCVLFTMMVLVMAKDPIKTLYNYPPKIQEKVKSLKEYQDKIPTIKNQVFAKIGVSLFIIFFVSFLMRYVNGCQTFHDALFTSYFIWTIINLYDVIVLDICWFCQSDKFVFPGTEEIRFEYRNYWFHIKEGLLGQGIGFIICILVGVVVQFLL